uniref:Uncharacterized protein n=1 Tax=Arundo donax TaxID=35708 RepID=A0A0A9EH70_ARUDO
MFLTREFFSVISGYQWPGGILNEHPSTQPSK